MTSLLCLVLVAGLSDPPAGLPGPGDRLPENEIKSTLQPPPVLATEVLASDSPILPSRRVLPQREWPNVWGYTGTRLITYGSKIAPNGVEYDPYFTFDLDINIEALPERELYLTVQNAFWTQRPGVGITNPAQGRLDFSKRQYDFTIAVSWNYYRTMEARFFAYSFNNLNRGFNSVGPWGYLDGVGVENRWYLTWNDIYDVPRQSFLSLGYFPSKDMIGQDKEKFQPSLFARAYLTYDLRPKTWFVYSDIQYICERPLRSRLWFFNQGFAIRPFERFRGTELRVGCETTWDVKANRSRPLLYTATYVNF